MVQNNVYIIVAAVYVLVIGYDILNWMRYRKFNSKEIKLKKLKSTVNFSILVVGLTLTFLSVLFHMNILNYSTPKSYNQVNELILKDFKGFKIPGNTLHGSNEFAFIVTSIEYKVQDNQIDVQSFFHPSRSYVYNEKLVDKSLLRHELYHFHITELFARKVRKELEKHSYCPSSLDIAKIISRYENEEYEMQRSYDHDSYHSYILKEQKKWENKIDSLLTLYQDHIAPTLTFNK